MPTTLIEPAELAASIERPDWVIVDCRFDLANPEWGRGVYAQSHIPGAFYADLDRDLSGPTGPRTGRHPLPALESLAAAFGRWGIEGGAIARAALGGGATARAASDSAGPDRHTQVIAYDQANGAYAARLWWLLRWAGHPLVAVLNGGFAAWQRAGLPVSADPPTRAARQFVPEPKAGSLVEAAQLERMVADGSLASGRTALVDARGADRFAGHNETLDPVAGHIPGARNHPFTGNIDAHGHFLAAPELRRRWQERLGSTAPADTIAMCGSGVTACHNLLAMEVAGLGGAQLYAGSWSEWIRDPGRPVARGAG